jgi:hypothetical protein
MEGIARKKNWDFQTRMCQYKQQSKSNLNKGEFTRSNTLENDDYGSKSVPKISRPLRNK